MEQQEHIHFISPGEHIHDTYPLAIKEERITRTYVIVEKEICSDNPADDEFRSSRKEAIRKSIKKVKEISKTIKIPYKTIFINSITIEAIRDAVLEVYHEFPHAKFSFNVSGGTKVHSIGLFWMSLWLDGTVYHTPTDYTINTLFIPRMHLQEIPRNPNYIEILKILDARGRGKSPELHEFVSRRNLSEEMQKKYHPVRDIGDKKTKRELGEGTLTKLLRSLEEWNLIGTQYQNGRKREKEYILTPDGDFALKIFLVQQKAGTGKSDCC